MRTPICANCYWNIFYHDGKFKPVANCLYQYISPILLGKRKLLSLMEGTSCISMKTEKDISIFIFAFHWSPTNSCRLLFHVKDFHFFNRSSTLSTVRVNYCTTAIFPNAGLYETIALLRSETIPQQYKYKNCKHGLQWNSYRPENIYKQLCEFCNHSYKTNTW